MKRFVTIVTILGWLVALYYGYIFLVRVTMKSAPGVDIEAPDTKPGEVPEDQAAAEKERKEKTQKEKAQEMRQQQKQLMEDRQRTMRYYQNR